MLHTIIPKLPAKNLEATRDFYVNILGFTLLSQYPEYLILSRDAVEVHFYLNELVIPQESDYMVYLRVNNIDDLYRELTDKGARKADYGVLENKPWGQREFSVTDVNGTCLTFGQAY
ncbi:MAG: VOC family protein [Saprospiraceae bacterium]|nr:VOC family protein [Saprospiraceae bacterium]